MRDRAGSGSNRDTRSGCGLERHLEETVRYGPENELTAFINARWRGFTCLRCERLEKSPSACLSSTYYVLS